MCENLVNFGLVEIGGMLIFGGGGGLGVAEAPY